LAIIAIVIFLPKSINGAGARNWNAIQVVTQVVDRADIPLQQYQRTHPIRSMFIYVPHRTPGTMESLDSWFTALESGVEPWNTLLTHRPLFVSNAPVNVGWSWLGYDLYNNGVGSSVVRIYAESPRILARTPSLSVPDEANLTLLAGQRLYQDALLDGQTNDKRTGNSKMPSSAECPEHKSIVGYPATLALLDSIMDKSIDVYAVPITRDDQLCYFGLIWSGLDDQDEMRTVQVVTEDREGFWVLLKFSKPSLHTSFPFWDFAAIPFTFGWQGYNSQTSVKITTSGLFVNASGDDAAIVSPEISLDTRQASHIAVTAQADAGNTIQLFWKTLDASHDFAEQRSLSQRLYADGAWHTYEFELTGHPQWDGTITYLRLDPTNTPGMANIAEIVIR